MRICFQHINTYFLSSLEVHKWSIKCGTIFYNFQHKNLVIHYPDRVLESYNFDGFLRKIFIKICYKLIIILSSHYKHQLLTYKYTLWLYLFGPGE